MKEIKPCGVHPGHPFVLPELLPSINGWIIGVKITWTIHVPFVWAAECLCSLVGLIQTKGVIINNQLKIQPFIFFYLFLMVGGRWVGVCISLTCTPSLSWNNYGLSLQLAMQKWPLFTEFVMLMISMLKIKMS